MSVITRGWDGLLTVFRATTISVLAFMMLSICYDAFMRYTFASPTSWSLEVNSFLIIYLAVMGAAEAQRHDAHIRISFFTQKFGNRVQGFVRVITGLLGVVFCTIMVWRGGLMAMQALEYGERVSSAFGTPMVIPYGLLPIGFAALGLQFAADTFLAFRQLCGRGYPQRVLRTS